MAITRRKVWGSEHWRTFDGEPSKQTSNTVAEKATINLNYIKIDALCLSFC